MSENKVHPHSAILSELAMGQIGFCDLTCVHVWGEEKGAVVAEGVYVGEDRGGHHSNLRCLSDSENISKYLHLHYCLFLSTTHTACISISATFFPCTVSPHTCLGWLEEGQ